MSESIYKDFGCRLAAIRKEAGMTQSEVAKKLHTVQSTYSGYELGTRKVTLELIRDLASIFEVTPDYLILGKNSHLSDGDKKISQSAYEVAQAYDAAEPRARESVRYTLDLPPESEKGRAVNVILQLPQDFEQIKERAESMSRAASQTEKVNNPIAR